jgi:hypothetical protein
MSAFGVSTAKAAPKAHLGNGNGFPTSVLPAFKAYEDRVRYVAISDADRHWDLRSAATIHQGVRLEDFPFDSQRSEDVPGKR